MSSLRDDENMSIWRNSFEENELFCLLLLTLRHAGLFFCKSRRYLSCMVLWVDSGVHLVLLRFFLMSFLWLLFTLNLAQD